MKKMKESEFNKYKSEQECPYCHKKGTLKISQKIIDPELICTKHLCNACSKTFRTDNKGNIIKYLI